MYVIAVYDVESSKCPRMMKLCRRFLHHIQNSVFEGEIKESNLEILRYEATKIMDDDDSFIIFSSRHQKWLNKEIVGADKRETSQFI